MFRWLKRLIWGRRSERMIFSYFDGKYKRKADPIPIERAMIRALGEDWTAVVGGLYKPPPPGLMGEMKTNHEAEQEKARAAVLQAICIAFDVEPFEDNHETDGVPTGLLEWQLLGLLEGYRSWCMTIIELAAPFVKPQSRASPTTASPPTSKQSESTSTASESPVQEPMLSPTPSESPLFDLDVSGGQEQPPDTLS